MEDVIGMVEYCFGGLVWCSDVSRFDVDYVVVNYFFVD